jgi:hypothetical protein
MTESANQIRIDQERGSERCERSKGLLKSELKKVRIK